MGGSGVGSGSHGGDVGGFEDEEAGGAGAASGGRDIDDDGNGGAFDGLDHVAGGVEQAAGGAERDEHGGGVAACGLVEAALDVAGGDGLDGVVEGELEDGCGLGEAASEEEGDVEQAVESRSHCACDRSG